MLHYAPGWLPIPLPRIPDLKHRRLYGFDDKPPAYHPHSNRWSPTVSTVASSSAPIGREILQVVATILASMMTASLMYAAARVMPAAGRRRRGYCASSDGWARYSRSTGLPILSYAATDGSRNSTKGEDRAATASARGVHSPTR